MIAGEDPDARYRAWLARRRLAPPEADPWLGVVFVFGLAGVGLAVWSLYHGGFHGAFWVGVIIAARGLPAGWIMWRQSRGTPDA